jgi:Rhodanese-like domain
MLSGFSTITEIFNKSYKRITFKDVQYALRDPSRFVLINTLSVTEQDCLIKNTMPYDLEERTMNELLNNYDLNSKKIIVYGKNTTDDSAEKKYKQLSGLGFGEIYIYSGGMFEWMLLQDIYGADEFPTTKKVLDILRFSGEMRLK